jgi:hypothetical protein
MKYMWNVINAITQKKELYKECKVFLDRAIP